MTFKKQPGLSMLAATALLLFPCFAGAVIFERTHALSVSPLQIFNAPGGNTFEYGNGFFQAACGFDICSNDVEGLSLAVGDTLRIHTPLESTIILTDQAGGSELFRGFLLRTPFPNHESALDVSTIETSARVTFYGASGETLGTFSSVSSMPYWEYEHFGDDAARFGIENIVGDNFLTQGQSMEIGGWHYEMEILADPNGLLSNSEWPYASFGLRADSIQVGQFVGLSHPVPEPGSIALLAAGLIGVCFGRRRAMRSS